MGATVSVTVEIETKINVIHLHMILQSYHCMSVACYKKSLGKIVA